MTRNEDGYAGLHSAFDDFGSNVAPPPRQRLSFGRLLGAVLLALVVVSGLVGALLLAGPALDVEHQPEPGGPEAVETP